MVLRFILVVLGLPNWGSSAAYFSGSGTAPGSVYILPLPNNYDFGSRWSGKYFFIREINVNNTKFYYSVY